MDQSRSKRQLLEELHKLREEVRGPSRALFLRQRTDGALKQPGSKLEILNGIVISGNWARDLPSFLEEILDAAQTLPDEETMQALESHVVSYLTKPFEPEELVATVEAYLRSEVARGPGDALFAGLWPRETSLPA
jgi:hypothetical protein